MVKKYVLVELDERDYRKLIEISRRMNANECAVASMLLTYALEKVSKEVAGGGYRV